MRTLKQIWQDFSLFEIPDYEFIFFNKHAVAFERERLNRDISDLRWRAVANVYANMKASLTKKIDDPVTETMKTWEQYLIDLENWIYRKGLGNNWEQISVKMEKLK